MHYAIVARKARQQKILKAADAARREAERLFQPHRNHHGLREVARITFPTRFRHEEFFVAVLLPIDCETVGRFKFICEEHRGDYYPPTIISGADGRRLRLMWQFPEIEPPLPLIKLPSDADDDAERRRRYKLLFHYAIVVMHRINDMFPHETIIYPSGGIMDLKTRLQAFD